MDNSRLFGDLDPGRRSKISCYVFRWQIQGQMGPDLRLPCVVRQSKGLNVMTLLYLTIDTEYSPGYFRGSANATHEADFARSISGDASGGSVGIFFQMDVLDRHGLKAVFFVDPMPALVWGVEAVARVVHPIIERGHEVQLHLHTEWLGFAGEANPLSRYMGRDIKKFTLEQQLELIEYARDVLIRAGAPAPMAFRAGNYAANDDTLRALSALGFHYDSSHCPGIADSDCDISLGASDQHPVEHCGVVECPVGCIEGFGGSLRHFQLTALTDDEIIAALRHAARQGQPSITLVSHSFELLSRDRLKVNCIVKRRFERMCSSLEALADVSTATFVSHPPLGGHPPHVGHPLPHNPFRTIRRYAEQAIGNALYGSR